MTTPLTWIAISVVVVNQLLAMLLHGELSQEIVFAVGYVKVN